MDKPLTDAVAAFVAGECALDHRTAYAMQMLLCRLVDEGYVRDERRAELLDRAFNLKCGHGFLTNAELSAPTPTPEEDLLS